LERAVRNKRKKLYDYETNPKNASDLVIPDALKKTISGQEFFYDSDGDKIYMFTTKDNLKYIR
jgi:hypothetical protein